MKHPFDISIGQRLAVSFGLLLFMLAAFVGVVANWNERAADAQDELSARVIPVATQVRALERALLQVGVAIRAHLLAPGDELRQEYREESQEARAALRRLAGLAKPAELQAQYARVHPVVEQYLEASDRLVERADTGAIGLEQERSLAATRAAAVDALERFDERLDLQMRGDLAAMSSARERATEGMWVATVFTALFFVIIGYFTARAIRRPTMRLLGVAAALERGDWQPALAWAPARNGARQRPVTGRNEILRLGRAFGAAAAAIESRERRMQVSSRIATAKASGLDREKVTAAALSVVVDHIGAEVGAMYWRDSGSDMLYPIARYGLAGAAREVRIGEGIPGQAARERGPIVARRIPRDSEFSVKLGYDQAPPRTVAAVPVLFREEVQGVLLVASLRELDEDAIAFLRDTGRQLGIGFQNLRAHAETQRLLAEVSEKNEQIQAQNEELQAQNEEIQAQSEEIQAQTEEIQAQNEEIQAHNEALKRQADDLRARSDMLAEADTRKNEFIGVLAHELRNPLAAITNSLVIAKRTPPGSEQSSRAQAVIERQAQQLVRLIDDLLDVTRISQGKIRIQRDALDLVEVVHSCIEDQRAALEASDLQVDLELPEDHVWVDGDRARLCQVLGNLLNNAIKFTDRGQRITVALHVESEAQVALHVIDRGIGIDPAFLPQLFQPFNQAVTRDRANTGLGLGLALVRELVKLHGGTVEAHSDGRGQGAEFIVRLPRRAPVEPPAPPAAPPAGNGRRILIVEDNEDVAETLQDLLSLEGHEVVMANSGAQALERAWRLQPHVVLCDIGLPDMDGYEVARRLRRDTRLQNVLLVALTGYTSSIDKQRAADAGFDHHLPKPPSIERMREIFEASEQGLAGRPG